MSASNNDPTAFAKVLRELIDRSNLSHDEWASSLGVSTLDFSGWLTGTHVPTAKRLHDLITLLRGMRDRLPDSAVDAFDSILRRPAREVSNLGDRMLPSIGHYMTEDLWVHVKEALERLSPRAAEEIMVFMIRMANDMLSSPEAMQANVLVDVVDIVIGGVRITVPLADTSNRHRDGP